MIDSVNFVNSVNETLENFITTNYDINNPFYEVWCAFDFEDVQKTFSGMNDGNLELKPVIHLEENNPINSPLYNDNNFATKVQKINLEYSVFCVVNDKIEPNKKRKMLINELSSKLKYKFDNNKEQLPRIRNISINYSQGFLNNDADGLYTSSQMLRFEVFKKLGS